jgi:hypothetical protein
VKTSRVESRRMDCEMNVNATSTDGGKTVISIFAKKEKKKKQ